MTLNLTATQVQERLTVTLVVASAVSMPQYIDVVVDGKAYRSLWTPGTAYTFTHTLALERGPHIIYGQVWTDSVGTVTTAPITYVMAYELTEYGIDVYSGDAKLDVLDVVLHDALLPDLPTLNFSCATLLTGNIEVVIRERGLRQYQFTITTVAISGPLYVYTCLASESYVLTTPIMALQTAYGSTADAIKLLVPSLNIVNADFLSQMTYPQLFGKITPTEVINQFLIQAMAQASVRNGNLYAFPLDVAGKRVTFSADIKSAVAGNVQFYTLGKYEGNAGLSCAATTTYQRFTMTGFFTYNPQGYNGDVCSLSFYGGYGSGVIPTVRNVEIDVDGVQVLVSATEFTSSPSEYCMKDITAIAQQNMIPLWYHDPDYHMQRLDPLTGWQRDADLYNAVVAHYIVKQYPTPATVLTLNDALIVGHWTGTVSNVTQVSTTLLPVPSGASGMLKSIGNCSRAALSVLFRDMDRIRFNWNPVTAAYVDISLQQDGANKLDLRHYFAGQSGAGFILNTGTASTDILYKDIALSPIQFVTTVTGTTTAGCSYRVKLLDAGGTTLWQDAWIHTIGNAFVANVPTSASQTYPATTVRIEFKDLYLIGTDYGVQAVTCTITGQTYNNVGSHERVVSSTQYYVNVGSHVQVDSTITYPLTFQWIQGLYVYLYSASIPNAGGGQWYTYAINILNGALYGTDGSAGGSLYVTAGDGTNHGVNCGSGTITATLQETVQDYEWQTVVVMETVQDYEWQPFTLVGDLAFFNLFEAVDLVLSDFTRTGNPTNLTTIALAFAGDNYVDSLVFIADNPLPVTVQAGTGSRAYVVTDDFGSRAGAQAYADGLLPIVSVAREQYTRDVSLATDLSVGDTIYGDENIFTINAIDYRQDGKTISAGRFMDTLMTRLAEHARRLGTLERKA